MKDLRVQGTVITGTVPTLTERNSGYTDLSDITGAAAGPRTDALGERFPRERSSIPPPRAV